LTQLGGYIGVLNINDPVHLWLPGLPSDFTPDSVYDIGVAGIYAKVFPPVSGVILYQLYNTNLILADFALTLLGYAARAELAAGAELAADFAQATLLGVFGAE